MLLSNYTARVVHRMDRTDRLGFDEEMARIGLDYEVYPAVNPPGHDDCNVGSTFSHTEVLKGVTGPLFVFEDDVCFIEQAREIFDIAIKELPDDFDMLYLGGNPKLPQIRYSEHLFRSEGGIHTNHAILYSEKAREYISKNYDQWTNEIAYYDHWLFVYGIKAMNSFIMCPMIAFQKPGFSNSRNCYQDYYMHIRSNEIRNLI